MVDKFVPTVEGQIDHRMMGPRTPIRTQLVPPPITTRNRGTVLPPTIGQGGGGLICVKVPSRVWLNIATVAKDTTRLVGETVDGEMPHVPRNRRHWCRFDVTVSSSIHADRTVVSLAHRPHVVHWLPEILRLSDALEA